MKNNKKVRKYKIKIVLRITFFSFKFFATVFDGVVFVGIIFVTSIISSHVISESPIMFLKYLPFPDVCVLGFLIHSFCLYDTFLDFSTHIDLIFYSSSALNFIFYDHIFTSNRMASSAVNDN